MVFIKRNIFIFIMLFALFQAKGQNSITLPLLLDKAVENEKCSIILVTHDLAGVEDIVAKTMEIRGARLHHA